jgi:hypothetical protein
MRQSRLLYSVMVIIDKFDDVCRLHSFRKVFGLFQTKLYRKGISEPWIYIA